MTIHASCGCIVSSVDDLVQVRFAEDYCDPVEGFIPSVTYAAYCRKCADRAEDWLEYIADDEAEGAFWRNAEKERAALRDKALLKEKKND